MKRRTPLRRGKPLARGSTRLKRSGRLKVKGRSRYPKRRDPKFLDFIRRLPCLIACRPPHVCRGYVGRRPVEPAHITTRGAGGRDVGNTVPLCPVAHDEQEGHTAEFERRYGVDLRSAAQQLAMLYRLATEDSAMAWKAGEV